MNSFCCREVDATSQLLVTRVSSLFVPSAAERNEDTG